MEHLLSLYERPYDPAYPVVCFDEKSYQLLADSKPALPMRSGHSHRADYEYRRRGTRNLFVMVEPLAGQRHVRLTKRRTKADFAHAVRYLVDVLYPTAKCIELVLDNLNTHTYQALVETFGLLEANRIMRRVCFHFTPVHGSWLNMAELEIGILSKQCLSRHLPSEQMLQTELDAWQSHRNAKQVKFTGRSRLKRRVASSLNTTLNLYQVEVLATIHPVKIRKKARQDRQIELKTAFEEVKAETEKAEITAVRTVYLTSTPEFCKFGTKSNETDVEEANG
jgi:DDE superfamily endonuclease